MAMVKSKAKGSRIFNFCNILFFALIMIVCILPVWHVFCASFSNASWVMNQRGLIWYIKDFTLNGYQLVFNDNSIWTGYLNTFIYVIGTTVLGMFLTVMAAYALSRKDFIWANPLMLIISFTMLFSGGLVPSYIINTRYLHLNNTVWIFLLPSLASAYNVIILRTFILSTIPDSLFEAARIDGAGHFRVFISIVLPLFKAGLATIGLFNVVSRWNDWFTGMLYITANDSLIPLQTLLQKIQSSIDFLKRNAGVGSTPDGLQYLRTVPTQSLRMACTVIIVVPILAAYPFFQRYFVQGLTMGSIKE